MAKDGTNRGGYRVGSGRKAKPLIEKINEGKVKSNKKFDSLLPEPAEFVGDDMPPVKDYLKAKLIFSLIFMGIGTILTTGIVLIFILLNALAPIRSIPLETKIFFSSPL